MISSISLPEISHLQGTAPPGTAPLHRLASAGLAGCWGEDFHHRGENPIILSAAVSFLMPCLDCILPALTLWCF